MAKISQNFKHENGEDQYSTDDSDKDENQTNSASKPKSQFSTQRERGEEKQSIYLSDTKSNHEMSDSENLFNSAAKKKVKIDKTKFKTEMCRNFMRDGHCQYGKKCNYAHGYSELQQKTNTNQFYKTRNCNLFYDYGWCNYGNRCHFVHDTRKVADILGESKVTTSNLVDHAIFLPASRRLAVFE